MKLTPNRRMAEYIGNALPLDEWIETLWDQYHSTANKTGLSVTSLRSTNLSSTSLSVTSLSLSEQILIWEQIIQQDEDHAHLLSFTRTAELAVSAWNLCIQWRVPHLKSSILKSSTSTFSFTLTEDIHTYLRWAESYQQYCQQENCIDFPSQIDVLIKAIQNNHFSNSASDVHFDTEPKILPHTIELVGFLELTPQYQELFKVLSEKGCKISFSSLIPESIKKQAVYSLQAQNPDHELTLSAIYAKKCLSVNKSINKNASIGIVVPDLESRRQKVVRIFQEHFFENDVNISAPVPLGSYPFIKSAFSALELLTLEPKLETISFWLRSPFFKGYFEGMEMNQRARIDILLRETKESHFSWKDLLSKIKEVEGSVFNIFNQFYEKNKDSKTRNSLKNWCVIFQESLDILGWPGDRPLTETEVQLKRVFDGVLDKFKNLDRYFKTLSLQDAIQILNRLAHDTPFLPKSKKAPIQILGVLEAQGIPFDHLWVMNMHQDVWPANPAPNPFIPVSLQQKLNLPRSTSSRELQVAKVFTSRFCQAAREVVFSFPAVVNEEPCSPSHLIAHFPRLPQEFLREEAILQKSLSPQSLSQDSIYSISQEFLSQETQNNEVLSMIPVKPHEKIRGGGKILKLQALCPFRAFSEVRLKTEPIPKASHGLGAAERGDIVHQILMYFWEEVQDSSQLIAKSEEDLIALINSLIERVLFQWRKKRPKTLTPKYIKLEQKRLLKLMLKFLELEKSRGHFTVIEREQAYTFTEQGFEFKVRIDRIDRLGTGEEIIIDYKTGPTSIQDWFGERPRDPQLPLYCLIRDTKPSGIVFAKLHPDDIKFHGLAISSDSIPGIKTPKDIKRYSADTTWESQLQTWDIHLKALLNDFIQGKVSVDPLDSENTCRLCSLKTVCRIKQ